ncbi:CxxxxCH/CxxCH domain-containing protein, partial [Geotalea sp. SG265]|uniref:CxxxxCH/CxxCH domain c-type cytochrome n=1 Tax=Geotalea sp. SG265 TaxID=2922867 RepID=UPI001FAEDB57
MVMHRAVKARWFIGQQLALLGLLLFMVGSAWGATVPNGTFPNSASWTFSTATFDTSTRTADGSGSARLATVVKGALISGTASQALSIPAGSVINTASLYSQLVFVGAGSGTGNTVTVALHYVDGSTANILSTGNLGAHTWTVRNGLVPVTLAQDVDQVIITMTAQSGTGGGTQTANIYVDEVTISYTPYSNPLLHNSTNLSTKYWPASGWGVAGGQYGEFTCSTCHTRTTTNIKRVVSSIPASIGTTVDKPVTFKNITAFGNDAGGHSTSLRICEVCHTQTAVHKYNQTTGDLNHKNANLTDCTSCHAHNKSFGASCNTCHGYPPINASLGTDGLASPATGILTSGAGAHDTHVNGRGMTCETCHQGYTQNPMGNESVEFGFNINGGTISGFKGTFNGGSFAVKTPYAPYSSNAKYLGTTVTMAPGNNNTCSNLYCHGGYAGSNGSLTVPSWTSGATAKACGACHGVSQTTPPTSGQHVRHTGTAAGNMGIACIDCHGTLPTDNAHVNGNVVTKLNPASKLQANATYKTFANQSSAALSYGTCSLYCHSTVQTADASSAVYTSTVPPKWDDPAFDPQGCGTAQCHGNPPSNANHSTHVSKGYDCAVCHSGAGKDTAKHADYNIDVVFSGVAGSGTYSQSPNTPGNGFGTCSATYCHSGAASAPTWGGIAMPGDCTGCHGNEVTAATKLSGAHNAHLNNTAQGGVFICSTCHAPTNNTANNRSITNSTLHVNGMVNYSGLYAGNNKTCSTFYCHSNGKGQGPVTTLPAWASGTTLGCNGCHGSTGNTSGMPTPDAVGVNSHTKHLPTQDTG